MPIKITFNSSDRRLKPRGLKRAKLFSAKICMDEPKMRTQITAKSHNWLTINSTKENIIC